MAPCSSGMTRSRGGRRRCVAISWYARQPTGPRSASVIAAGGRRTGIAHSVRSPGAPPARHLSATFVTLGDCLTVQKQVHHANEVVELAIAQEVKDTEDKEAGHHCCQTM